MQIMKVDLNSKPSDIKSELAKAELRLSQAQKHITEKSADMAYSEMISAVNHCTKLRNRVSYLKYLLA